MRPFLSKRPPLILWALALAGFAIAVGATKAAGYDIWWHLKTGELIWQWQEIPRYDFFSYTAFGRPWFNHEWLFQVGAWLLYSKFGVAALTVMKLALTIGIAYFVFRTFNLLLSSAAGAAWGTLLLLWGIADRIMERPFLISLLFLTIFCFELHRFISGRKRALWLLPLLQVLWINLHGAGGIGPLIVAAVALGESLQAFVSNYVRGSGPVPLTLKARHHLWLTVVLTVAACMVNPRGIDVWFFSLQHFKMEAILAYTQEWLPVWDPRLGEIISQIIFRFVVVLTLLSYLVNRRQARISHLMLTVITSLMILKGKRFTPDFLVVNLPLLFFNLKEGFLKGWFSSWKSNVWGWINITLVFALSISALRYGIPLTIHSGPVDNVGLGTTADMAPEQMVQFLEENDISGNVFHDMGVGSYLLFKRWPRQKVFIDGRTPVYGDDFYKTFIDAFQHSRNFEKLDRQYHFDYLVFKGYGAWDLRYMHKYLWESPQWHLVYLDHAQNTVYLRDKPEFRGLIKRYSWEHHPLVKAWFKGK